MRLREMTVPDMMDRNRIAPPRETTVCVVRASRACKSIYTSDCSLFKLLYHSLIDVSHRCCLQNMLKCCDPM
jgi:hypothetical protein